VVAELQAVLRQHPGMTEVHLELLRAGRPEYTLKLDDSLRVTASPSLMADLKQLLGAGCLA
jgi:DNA polymerase-3 subunit alpha